MEKAELLATLAKVRDELANAKELDDETREMLTTLTDDIKRLSDEENAESAETVGRTGQRFCLAI